MDKKKIRQYHKGSDLEVDNKIFEAYQKFEEYWWKEVEEHERYYFVDDAISCMFLKAVKLLLK